MTKQVSPELIEKILEQQEKNHRKYIESLKTLFNPAPKPTFIRRAIITIKDHFYGRLQKFKRTEEDIQILKFRIDFSIGPNTWDWHEDPITCLKQLGENPNDYEFWDLYNKMAEAYSMRHNKLD